MPPPSSGGIALRRDAEHARGLRPRGRWASARPRTCTSWPRRCAAPSPTARATWATRTSTRTCPIDAAGLEGVRARSCARRSTSDRASSLVARDASRGRPRATRRRTSRSSTRTRNAVALTYTLEDGYGSRIVVPGAGFLLNNEMGDFNAGPGLTDRDGPHRHRAQPRRARQAHALEHDARRSWPRTARLFMVTGSPGGRTIINTVLQTILERRRLRHERAGGRRRAALPSPVAARPDRCTRSSGCRRTRSTLLASAGPRARRGRPRRASRR